MDGIGLRIILIFKSYVGNFLVCLVIKFRMFFLVVVKEVKVKK